MWLRPIRGLTLLVGLFTLVHFSALPARAQGSTPLSMDFVTVGGGPPTIEFVDGTLVFKITVIDNVTGDLSGTLTESITQVFPLSDEEGLLPITTIWKLETAAGTIEGYYAGTFQHLQDLSHSITQHGEVLSVTGAYLDLYQAKVSYRATLDASHLVSAGTLVIYRRERL